MSIDKVIRLRNEESSRKEQMEHILKQANLEYLINRPPSPHSFPDFAKRLIGEYYREVEKIQVRLAEIEPETNVCLDFMRVIGYGGYKLFVAEFATWVNRKTVFKFVPDWFEGETYYEVVPKAQGSILTIAKIDDIGETPTTFETDRAEYKFRQYVLGSVRIAIALNEQHNSIQMKQ